MTYLTLLVGIFSFVPTVSYTAEIVSCEKDDIVMKWEESVIQVELFNVSIPDENWDKVCEVIENKEITFEIDPSTVIVEPLDIYMFVDKELYQSYLIEHKLAQIQIKNPEFTYYDLFFHSDTQKPVISKHVVKEVVEKKSQGYIVIVMLFIMWLIMVIYMSFVIRKRKKRS